jgi:hypothetical protein
MISYELNFGDDRLFSIPQGSKAERKLISLLKSLEYWSNPIYHDTEYEKLTKELNYLQLEQNRLRKFSYWNPPHVTDPQLALEYLQDFEQSRKYEVQISDIKNKRNRIQARLKQNRVKKIKVNIIHV